MPKYWGKQIFTHGRFTKVGQKQKTERKKEEERLKVGNNYGELRIATPPRVAHAKPPGPKEKKKESLDDGKWPAMHCKRHGWLFP